MGCEKDKEFYNRVYSTEEKYADNYKELPYYPVFLVAKGMIGEIENPRIIELGCGTGQFAQMLWDNGFKEYLGIDLSERAIHNARMMSPQAFEVEDIRSYVVDAEKFNTIVALEVFEHIKYDLEMLGGLPSGISIIFSLPTFDGPGHVRFFKRKEDIEVRYSEQVDIQEIVKYQHWHIVKGVVR